MEYQSQAVAISTSTKENDGSTGTTSKVAKLNPLIMRVLFFKLYAA